ncbi:hypothetical protein CHH83_06600 [Bacillus sp. 7586-K]|nr:hypothetical protein CHH83_06600 [Bacillus sp. 7586-K]
MIAEVKANEKVVNTHFLSKNSMDELKQRMNTIHLRAGEYLYSEGEKVNKLFYLVKGTITLYKSNDEGKVLTLNYYTKDDMFGDDMSHDDGRAMENAKAIEDSVIGVIEKQEIEMLLWRNREFSIEFTKWVSYSQLLTQTKLRDLMFFGKNGALASVLIRMTNTYGIKNDEKWDITKKFTHDEIACLIGTPRETVTRIINQYRKDGLVAYDKGYITILNLEGLRSICKCEDCPMQVCRL